MPLSPLAENRLDRALRNNGYHIPRDTVDGWLAADATFWPGRCYVTYGVGGEHGGVAATSLPHVARAYLEEGAVGVEGIVLPPGAVTAFIGPIDTLPRIVRRLHELSCALPTAPLDRCVAEVGALPQTTEAERLAVQRVGQDIFRAALMELWSGRCAVTGVDQPELLRASHMKPWADCASGAERLDPMNGLLLAAHWDAAFDRGLVTFEADGAPRFSPQLNETGQRILSPSGAPPRLSGLRQAHGDYLDYHRAKVWPP